MLPVDCRTRMCSNLVENYFRNRIGAAGIVIMKEGELIKEGGIAKAAMEINKMISRESHHEKVMNNYESWLKIPIIEEPGLAHYELNPFLWFRHGDVMIFIYLR